MERASGEFACGVPQPDRSRGVRQTANRLITQTGSFWCVYLCRVKRSRPTGLSRLGKCVDFGYKMSPCSDVTCPMCLEKTLKAGRCSCGFDVLVSIEKSARVIKNVLLFSVALRPTASFLTTKAA